MRVLFLDDDKQRHAIFLEWCAEFDIVPDRVFDADAAADALKKSVYDVCFLDHDLAEEHYGALGEKKGDGTALVRWMVADGNRHLIPKLIVVHSYNPDGAKRMLNLLLEMFSHWGVVDTTAVWNPFGPGLKRFLRG